MSCGTKILSNDENALNKFSKIDGEQDEEKFRKILLQKVGGNERLKKNMYNESQRSVKKRKSLNNGLLLIAC